LRNRAIWSGVDKRQSKRTVDIEVSLILLFCQELSASEGVVFGRNPWATDHPAHEKTAKQALFRHCLSLFSCAEQRDP
jgi:hypothetical protein